MNPSIPTVAKPANVDEAVWQRMLAATPAQARHIIRSGAYDAPTSGLCPGFAQANLIVLPKEQAYDFLLFAQRNPKPCPLLEVTEVGARETTLCATDCNVATDFPRYRIYENGNLVEETTDVSAYWRDDLVSFIIGCSFSFESELIEAGIEQRHNTMGCNVSMYLTNVAPFRKYMARRSTLAPPPHLASKTLTSPISAIPLIYSLVKCRYFGRAA